MTMKSSAAKAAEKAMWERIAAAFTEDEEVTALCRKMLEKYAPTEAEIFAAELLDAMVSCGGVDVCHTSKQWALLCGVSAEDARRVPHALRRLVLDGKVRKMDAPEDAANKAAMYAVC